MDNFSNCYIRRRRRRRIGSLRTLVFMFQNNSPSEHFKDRVHRDDPTYALRWSYDRPHQHRFRMHLTALTDSSNLPKIGVTVQAQAKHRDSSSRPLLSPSTTIKWKIVRWRRQFFLMKSLVTFIHVCSSYLPVSPPFPFRKPSPSSILLSFLPPPPFLSSFIHFTSEASRGYLMSAGVIQRHLFSSSLCKSSSPLIVCNSSSPKIFYKSTLTGNYHRFPSRRSVFPRTTVTPSLCASYLYYRLPITTRIYIFSISSILFNPLHICHTSIALLSPLLYSPYVLSYPLIILFVFYYPYSFIL